MNDFEIKICLDNIRNEAIRRQDTALKLLVEAAHTYLEKDSLEDLENDLRREGIKVQ